MTTELTKAAQQALEACPFCGADPQDARHIEYGRWAVTCRCGASGASANTGPNATDAAKIKAYSDARTTWNTRALTQRPAAQEVDDGDITGQVGPLPETGWDEVPEGAFRKPSPTAGMNLGERIKHVGGRENAAAEHQVREICLGMQKDVGEMYHTSMGYILVNRPGKLYVGGLYICDTELKFGYNINPSHISLERDRQTVSGFDLKFTTKEMWFLTQRYAEIAKMIEDKVPDLECAEYGTPELVKEACYLAFRAKYPGAVIVKSQDELDALVKRGMTTEIVVHDRWAPIVSSHKGYKAEVMVPVAPPVEVLRQWLSVNRKAIRSSAIESFKLILKQSETWRLK